MYYGLTLGLFCGMIVSRRFNPYASSTTTIPESQMQTLTLSVPVSMNMAALREAFVNAGGTIEDVVAAATSTLMIDGDAQPIEPDWAQPGKTVHIPSGQHDSSSLVFFQTEEMKNGSYTIGDQLSDKARQAKLRPHNANSAVFLEAHQEFLANVPKGINYLVFTDTKFLDGSGCWYFRCLRRTDDGVWVFRYCHVGYGCSGQDAVVASAS